MLTATDRPLAANSAENRRAPIDTASARIPTGGGAPNGQANEAAATATLAMLTLASSWGLLRVFSGNRWIVPVVVTSIAVHGISWITRRLRLPVVAAAVLDLVPVVMLPAWTVIGSTTSYGLPTASTFSTGFHALDHAYRDIPSVVAPIQGTTGFLLAAAVGAGLAALLGDWLAFRSRSATWGSAPAFTLFIVCCIVGYGPGRQWAVILEAAALILFLLVHGISLAGTGVAWLGGVASKAARWAIPVGGVVAAGAILVVPVVAPAATGVEGAGVLGWRSGPAGGGGPRQVANPIVDLHTRLVELSNVGVFTVRSQMPSYWRLTSLDTFTGESWVATNSYRGFGSKLPGIASVPAGTRTFEEQFHVLALESVWLPAAFTPVSVSGVRGVGFDPSSSSLITSHRTSDGLNYTVTSYQYLSTLDPAQLQAARTSRSDPTVGRYLDLPAVVPQSVYALAAKLTAGKRTDYDRALALQDFFLGPTFQYSLDPPADGAGVDALLNFLFTTRTGYCQQFAGAYAVLARAAGLPTRLAVGFTTGQDQGGGLYRVTDADAHTWPEVYFGPKLGWVPFEPTKSFSDPSSQGYAPPVPGGGSSQGPVGELPPAARPSTPPTTPSDSSAPSGSPTPPVARPQSHGGTTSNGGWAVVGVMVGLVLAWWIANLGLRRLRWRVRRWRDGGDARSRVLTHWSEVGELLSWWGVRRSAGETDTEFARRAGRSLSDELHEPSPWVAFGVGRMAALANEAAFAPAVHPGAAREAALVSREIKQRLMKRATGRLLVKWALVQRPGHSPLL